MICSFGGATSGRAAGDLSAVGSGIVAVLLVAACGSASVAVPASASPSSRPAACAAPAVAPASNATAVPQPVKHSVIEAMITILNGTSGTGIAGVAVGFGSVWVTGHRSHDVYRIDPATNRVVATIPLPTLYGADTGPDSYIGSGPHGIWLPVGSDTTPNQIVRIDPATNKFTIDQALPGVYQIVDTAAGVWAGVDPYAGADHAAIFEVDPVTGKTLKHIDLAPAPAHANSYFPSLDAGFGSLWAVAADNEVARINPTSGTVIATIKTSQPVLQIDAGGPSSGVFLAMTIGSTTASVARVNVATNCVDGIAFIGTTDAESAIWIAGAPEGVYVAYGAGSLVLINPSTMQAISPAGLDGQDYLGIIADGFGSVWFPTFGNNSVLRVKPLG